MLGINCVCALTNECSFFDNCWYGNAFDASSEYTCDTVVGLDQKKQYLSSSHTFGKWFSCFMRGVHLRMGMVRRQNEALTSELVLRMCNVAEGEWRAAQNPARQIDVEDTVCFLRDKPREELRPRFISTPRPLKKGGRRRQNSVESPAGPSRHLGVPNGC